MKALTKELPLNEVVCGDALEVMRTFPKKSIDLVLTDPPFFTPASHYQSRIKWERTFSDLSPLRIFWSEVTKEVVRILKKTGHFITFCNGDSYPVFYEPMFNAFEVTKSLVWNKKEVGLGRIWRHQHELLIAARNTDCKFNNDKHLHVDVLSFKATPSTKRSHPIEKPTRLLKELIKPTTLKGDVVLDPFCGSGTTLIASHQLGRRWIGVDLNPKYVEVAKKNLAKFTFYKPLEKFVVEEKKENNKTEPECPTQNTKKR